MTRQDIRVGPEQPTQPSARSRWRMTTWAILAAAGIGFAVGAFVLLLGAFDVAGFAGAASAYSLGYLLSVGAHGLTAALLVSPYAQRSNSAVANRMLLIHRRLPWFNHVKTSFVIGLLALAVIVVGDVWLVRVRVGTITTTLYFVAAAIGVLLVVFPFPRQWSKLRDHDLAPNIFAGIDGLVAGAIFVVGVIILTSIYRQSHLGHTKVDIQTVSSIQGSYLSLGDSYSSGEGLPPFADKSGCDQSVSGSYSAQLLTHLPKITSHSFQACSGAVSDEIFGLDDHSAQVDGRVHSDVGLVTLTIGGNDVGFSNVVVDCFKAADCRKTVFSPVGHDTKMPPPEALATWAPKALRVVGGRLATIYGSLRHDYPNARIVVIGYPHLFPRGSAHWYPDDCASVLRRVSQNERDWVDDRIDELNNLIYAETANAGIEFVSPLDTWVGHEPCGTKGQYTNSVKPILSYKNPIDGGSFHPTGVGQQQLAALVASYLRDHSSPPNLLEPGHHLPVAIGTDLCPAHLGLVRPYGDHAQNCS